MTEKPVIAAKTPAKANLERSKKYFWCACGRSASQPFCDGSHRGTGIKPLPVSVDEDTEAFLCRCKSTGNPPYCDGSHTRLGSAKPGDPAPARADGPPQAVPTPEEPTVARIHALARDGLSQTGHHGEMAAMGVPLTELPRWSDIQFVTAQFASKPLMEDVKVGTSLVIGPRADKPLELEIPLFVSDMSFGALSEEAKIALSRGAELAGTGI